MPRKRDGPASLTATPGPGGTENIPPLPPPEILRKPPRFRRTAFPLQAAIHRHRPPRHSLRHGQGLPA